MIKNDLKNRWSAYFPLLLLLFNVLLRSLFLTEQDIGLDEPFSIYQAQFGIWSIIDHLKHYNNPPLFELVLHVWIKLFGISPLSVRILPLIFASLAPLALYYFASRNFSVRIAQYSSVLLSVAYLLQYYAHDCRVYTLFLLLTILSMLFFMEMLKQEKFHLVSLFFIVTTTLLIYAHYFGIFILFFQGIYLLLYHRPRLLKMSVYYGVIILLYLPQLYVVLTRATDSVSRGTWVKPPNGIESLYNMLWTFSNFPFVTVACITILICALTKAIIQKRKPGEQTTLVLIWFLFPYLGMFILSYWVPMYIGRYLIYALPAYFLLIVLSLGFLFENKPKLSAIITAALILCFAFTLELSPDKKQPVSQTVNFVKQHKHDSSLVLICPYNFLEQFAYHYNRQYFSTVHDGRERHLTDSLLASENVRFLKDTAELSHLPADFKILIFVGAGEGCNDEDGYALRFLNSHYKRTVSQRFTAPQGVHIFELK